MCFILGVKSKTVVRALEVQGQDQTTSTRLFIDYMDDFFDYLNASSTYVGLKKIISSYK